MGDMDPEDDDFIEPNLCDIDSDEYALTAEEAEYFPLFPDGKEDAALAAEWKELLG